VLLAASTAHAATPDLRVSGNHLIDGPGKGHVVQLRGVDRSGLEYACIQGYGFFESPHPYQLDTQAMIAAMKSWDINAVRVPLNEDCWLGLHTKPGLGGPPYRKIVKRYVQALNAAHLYVILDLHWASPGRGVSAMGQLPMTDRDLSPRFWHSVASAFQSNHALIFDLFNEPFRIGWSCWLHGCQVPAGNDGSFSWPSYRAAGMQELVRAVRRAGARQPLMLGGLSYALDISGWNAHAPHDPKHQLVASEHSYGVLAPCDANCKGAIVATHRKHPIVIGELGETDCGRSYIDTWMPFFDSSGISYLGWAWDTGGGWTCTNGPSLITDYAGDPTAFGVGLRDHLRALGVPSRPS
jgi:hypothetical protein